MQTVDKTVRFTVLAVISLSLAACGGGAASSAVAKTPASTAVDSTAAATPATNFGAQYLAMIQPFNTEADAFNAKLSKLPSSATPDDVAAAAKPLLASLTDTDNKLLRVSWPANASADIKTLVTDDYALAAAISNTSLSGSAYVSALSSAAAKVAADSNIVRADLGLPAKTP